MPVHYRHRCPVLPQGVQRLRFGEVHQVASQKDRTYLEDVLHEWLLKGAEETVLRMLEEGEISHNQATEALQITAHDLVDLVLAWGMRPGLSQENLKHVARDLPLKSNSSKGLCLKPRIC